MKKSLGKRHSTTELSVLAENLIQKEDLQKGKRKKLMIAHDATSSESDNTESDSDGSDDQSIINREEKSTSRLAPSDSSKPGWHWKFSPDEILRELERDEQNITTEKLKFITEKMKKDEIAIEQSRGFLHSDKYGWHWHKSWTLPSITILNQAADTLSQDTKPIVMLKAVKIFHDKGEHVKLQKIELRGDTTKNFTSSKVCFSKIKFTTTSYKNDGLKFHLVVNIVAQDSQQPSKNRILHSMLSPPIFVDSSSQTKKTKRMRKTNGYFSPFDPKYLKKKYTKKDLTVTSKGIEYKIQNNFIGLYNYLTAINIKHKTKHPLFLSIEFSKCFRLYYNSQILANTPKLEEEIISRLQIIMNNLEVIRDHNKIRNSLESTEILEKKLFIFYVEIPNDSNVLQSSRLILDYLEPLKHDLLGYCFNLPSIPTFFTETSPTQLVQTYNAIYPFLFKLKGSYNPLNMDSTKFFVNQIPTIKHSETTETNSNPRSETIETKDGYNPAVHGPSTSKETQDKNSLFTKININKPLIHDILKSSSLEQNSYSNMGLSNINIGPNTPLNLPALNYNNNNLNPFSLMGRDTVSNLLLRNALLQNISTSVSPPNFSNLFNQMNIQNYSNFNGLNDRALALNNLRSLFLQLSLSYIEERRIPTTLPEIMSVIEKLLQNYQFQ